MHEDSFCFFCEHYDEIVDYCELGLFEGPEKVMEDCDTEEKIEDCMWCKIKNEKG